jgi:UDP-glucose 4-epimerase
MVYKISKKKILITGATGQIGSFLIERLVKENAEIFAVGRSKNELREIQPFVESQKIKFLECDITNEKSIKKNSKFLNDINFFVHLSSGYRFDLSNSMTSNHHTIEHDLKGTIKILKEFKNLEGIIFASSISIYGKPEYLPVDEDCSVNPNHFYGVGKFGAEKILQSFASKNKIPLTILRIAAVVGERNRSNQIIPICVNKALKNETINVNEKSSRDYIHIFDLIEFLIRAIKKNKNDILNIGSGEKTSADKIIKKIINLSNSKSKITYSKKTIGYDLIYNISRAVKNLHYKPKYCIEKGILDEINWYKNSQFL